MLLMHYNMPELAHLRNRLPLPNTNPSIFLRLRQSDDAPREVAWVEFEQLYSPIIGGFARRLGAKAQDVDDIVQDVLTGFFATSPAFVYDPARGRFRGYLKVCTYRAAKSRLGAAARVGQRPLQDLEPDALAVEQVWNDVWEQEKLRVALEQVRHDIGRSRTFKAFQLYVLFDQPAEKVAEKLRMHINSVYRAKEQVTKLLQQKVLQLSEDDDE
jgi:RNA polymerase sigma factor (sigma-70 family)